MQPSSRTLPPPTVAEPLPLAPGQSITIKNVDQNGQPTLVTYKILGSQDGAYWFEMSIDSYSGHSAMKMLVNVGDRRDPATMDVRAMLMKDNDGRVTELPAETLSMVRGMYQPMLDQLVIRWDQMPQEDAQVIAGTFAACYKGRSTVSFANETTTSDVWFHPAVPVNGMVKSVGVDSPMTTELVDFGMEGATSEF